MRNVHEFDGKLYIKTKKKYGDQEEKKIWDDAKEYMMRMNDVSMRMAHSILHDPHEKNVDNINQDADARQVFLELLTQLNHMDDIQDKVAFYSLLEEQLEDMYRLGQCPQGRTIRLWQLLQSLERI